MKKYFALIISILVLMTCFTACKPEIKGGSIVTNAAGEEYAAVTKADGGIVRDEAGNLILLVTDAKGNNVKDENGEYQTNPIALDHALVIGNRIECPDYAINIPDGWADSLSFSDLVIKKNGTEDQVKIITDKTISLSETFEKNASIITTASGTYSGTTAENKAVKIGDKEAQFCSVYVPDTGVYSADGKLMSTYIGFIAFENNGIIYNCMLSSNRDMGDSLEEIIDILETIEYIH